MSIPTKSRKKRSILWNIPKQELELIINNSSSYSEILRKLGIFSQGSNINTLKRRILSDGIDTSHIPKGMNSCKGRKFGPHKCSIPNDILFVENSSKSRSIIRRRILRDGIIPYECSKCGLPPIWNNMPMSMVLDHINGVPNDNRIENLRFLCPNCNSQTDTFAGRNVKCEKQSKKCLMCENIVYKTSKLCSECYTNRKTLKLGKSFSRPNRRKFEISKEELEELIKNNSYVSIGKMFGVSDNSIRKRCKTLGIIV